jgi:hypothetical protein
LATEEKCANQNGIVDHFVLWDTEKEKMKKQYKDLGKFCSGKHTLEATLHCADDVQSVKFEATSGNATYTFIDNHSPNFFLYGTKGKTKIISGKLGPAAAVFDLTATPYTEKNAGGIAGKNLKIKVDFRTKCNNK